MKKIVILCLLLTGVVLSGKQVVSAAPGGKLIPWEEETINDQPCKEQTKKTTCDMNIVTGILLP